MLCTLDCVSYYNATFTTSNGHATQCVAFSHARKKSLRPSSRSHTHPTLTHSSRHCRCTRFAWTSDRGGHVMFPRNQMHSSVLCRHYPSHPLFKYGLRIGRDRGSWWPVDSSFTRLLHVNIEYSAGFCVRGRVRSIEGEWRSSERVR